MEKIKLEVAGIPAVLYGKRSRKVYLYVHGKNGSAAEAARFARTACPAGWQVLAVDLPEHGALLCPNHNSNWDPVLVALKVPVNYRLHIMA